MKGRCSAVAWNLPPTLAGYLLANETCALVKGRLQAEEQAAIRVKDFRKPVRTFRITGVFNEATAAPAIIDGVSS